MTCTGRAPSPSAFGAVVSLFAVLTGFWDWRKSTEKGTQARRTASAHGWTMVAVTLVVFVNVGLRWFAYGDAAHTPGRLTVLSVVAALLMVVGGTIGGSLAYDYGFNVETAGDSPVWHPLRGGCVPGRQGLNGGTQLTERACPTIASRAPNGACSPRCPNPGSVRQRIGVLHRRLHL